MLPAPDIENTEVSLVFMEVQNIDTV